MDLNYQPRRNMTFLFAVINLILVNLAIAEFLLSCVGVSTDVSALLNDGWDLGKLVCYTTGSISTTAGTIFSLPKCTDLYANNYITKEIKF